MVEILDLVTGNASGLTIPVHPGVFDDTNRVTDFRLEILEHDLDHLLTLFAREIEAGDGPRLLPSTLGCTSTSTSA